MIGKKVGIRLAAVNERQVRGALDSAGASSERALGRVGTRAMGRAAVVALVVPFRRG